MPLTYYYDLLSQPCRALMIFLQVNKIPFERREIDLSAGEQFTETFGKLNRFHKVPVITDGDFTLIESVAILRYLCRERTVQDHWYPQDSKKQARVDEYLEWQHLNTRLHCSVYMLRKFMLPLMSGRPANASKVAESLKHMEKTLDAIETKWLPEGQLYLTGDHISVADLLGACEIEQTKLADFNPIQGRPKIAAWLERVRKETHPYYEEAHGKMWSMADKHKNLPPPASSQL